MKTLGISILGGMAFAGLVHVLHVPLWPAVALFALGGFVQLMQEQVRS